MPPVYLLLLKVRNRAASLVPIFVVIATQRERPPIQLRDAHEDSEQIAEMAERFESPIGERANIRGEPDAEKIERISFAAAVRRASLDRRAACGRRESPCSEASAPSVVKSRRNELPVPSGKNPSEIRRLACARRENAVENFVCGAIAADRDKSAIALIERFSRKLRRVPGPPSRRSRRCATRLRAGVQAPVRQASRSGRRQRPDLRLRRSVPSRRCVSPDLQLSKTCPKGDSSEVAATTSHA